MADKQYWAWSEIRHGAADGKSSTSLNFGDEVARNTLDDLSDEGFQQLIDSGAIRRTQPPEVPDTWQDSPINYLLDQAKKASEGVLAEANTSPEVMAAAQMSNAVGTGDPATQEAVVREVSK